MLHARGIDRVWLCGLATDFCVGFSALDASAAGFAAYVIEEACRGIDAEGSLAAAWERMAQAGVAKARLSEALAGS
jgi:nicotinamidase/pyrazinamidase